MTVTVPPTGPEARLPKCSMSAVTWWLGRESQKACSRLAVFWTEERHELGAGTAAAVISVHRQSLHLVSSQHGL